jgi:baculoviral IAP repeat-containing protein 6
VQSLANIDLLKVTYWNPAKTVLDVLRQMKSILLQHARLDVDADRNDISAYPEGAYHPIEDHLIKLALVCMFHLSNSDHSQATECRPRANSTIIDVDSLEKAPQMRQQQITVPMVDLTTTGDSTSAADNNSAVDSALTGWAKGTGYGSGNRQSTYGWNPDEYLRAQKEKDRQILAILEALLENISHNRRSISSTELYQIIEGSAFIPFLEVCFDINVFLVTTSEMDDSIWYFDKFTYF